MLIDLVGTPIELLPERAAWLPETRDLIVADLHLGKAATFRARGIPVPEGDNSFDLERLSRLIVHHQAARVIIAGDLIHAPEAMAHGLPRQLSRWIEECTAEVILVEGNHDRRAGTKRIPCLTLPKLEVGPLTVVHDPADFVEENPGISGHLHPAVSLRESPRRSRKHLCFWLRAGRHLVLPAFGTFTGTHPIAPSADDRVFLPLTGGVKELPSELLV